MALLECCTMAYKEEEDPSAVFPYSLSLSVWFYQDKPKGCFLPAADDFFRYCVKRLCKRSLRKAAVRITRRMEEWDV